INLTKDAPPPKEPAQTDLPNSTELRIVVLRTTDGRYYRVEGDTQAHTFEEVQALVAKRRAQQPPLHKLVIVLYDDSPDQDTTLVRQLETLAQDNGLTPEISKPPGKVP